MGDFVILRIESSNQMPTKLCNLKDTFFIEDRGVILVLPSDEQWGISKQELIHRHEKIFLLSESGEKLDTFVKDLDFTVRNGGRDSDLCFTLPRDVKPEMVTLPSEIWLCRDDSTPILKDGVQKTKPAEQAVPPKSDRAGG